LSLETDDRRRIKRDTNEPGCPPVPRGQRRGKATRNRNKSTVPGAEHSEANGTGNSSRSAVIVPETGEPRPEGTLTYGR